MTQNPWIVFAGGGTGGHLFPALGVVEALRGRSLPVDVTFFCTTRPIDGEVLGRAGLEAVPQSVLPFTSKPWRWPAFLRQWRRSVTSCHRAFTARRPAVVVGAGGYASGPPVHAAMKLGIPTYLLNPDALPGRANRWLARRKDLSGIFAQWPVTKKHFSSSARVIVAGCPVRPAFRALPDAHLDRHFGLVPERKTLLITGASQGARTINEALIDLADQIARTGWQVLHLSGTADRDRVEQAYARAAENCRPTHFPYRVLAFSDLMAEAMVGADLIVSRAGASSLAEIQVVGKPSVLLPYPFHRDKHQWHNAAVLSEAGAAVLIDDTRDGRRNAELLGPILADLMGDDNKRDGMSAAVRSLAYPESAERIAEYLLAEAKKPLSAPVRSPS
ncbi:MAG: UDP-N-acetylglucosamine--N-acetylmuramyl-(pentapeptide) pyrophosphoryl-undecaprenol N-acetylglucosamine transferase [Phycisphaerales bacterium]|nr:UDP-N-acetylglucosamine--N-acetylmuramyl-(pentapeptide) pyrophosphoryl-undecaprenol N-acetylglucosamine transferase [Phycisphaerales bacterium]